MSTTECEQIVDIAPYLANRDIQTCTDLAQTVAQTLHSTGMLVIRDPRVQKQDNETFLDLMERYFSQPPSALMEDARPHLSYQVGSTPEGTERPRVLHDTTLLRDIQNLPDDAKPLLPTGADCKWRFMWRVGPRPAPGTTQYPELNAAPVIPDAFPEWQGVMDGWGHKMLAAVQAVAELAAVGLGLPPDAFTSRMTQGPHLLAPTGTDLQRHATPGTVFAGYHYDLNFITIHGRSRFPGLFAWTRQGQRVPVRIPDGCLLLQAGKQLEWLTGGYIRAGFHEVVCTEETLQAVETAKAANCPLWRVSSTVFSHIASDVILQPLGRFGENDAGDAVERYPPTPAGLYVQQELRTIKLRGSPASGKV